GGRGVPWGRGGPVLRGRPGRGVGDRRPQPVTGGRALVQGAGTLGAAGRVLLEPFAFAGVEPAGDVARKVLQNPGVFGHGRLSRGGCGAGPGAPYRSSEFPCFVFFYIGSGSNSGASRVRSSFRPRCHSPRSEPFDRPSWVSMVS